MNNIQYSKAAVNVIKNMDRKTKQRIKSAIESIPDGDIRPLRGSSYLYRLRVGNWRVLYTYPDNDSILVVKIGARGDVYKGGL